MLCCGLSASSSCLPWLATYRQLGYWQDNVTLWSHAIDVTSNNFLAENNLGKALLTKENWKKASHISTGRDDLSG